MSIPDRQLGEFGEQEVRSRLERALLGTGIQFSGYSDKGIDLILQFESPAPDRQPLHFGVQVKTGESFAIGQKNRWKIRNLDQSRFRQWTMSRLPILFVWVRPTSPAKCFWAIIRRDSSIKYFSISKKSTITPSLRYKLALEYGLHNISRQLSPISILRPPLGIGLRPHAKDYYRSILMKERPVNPLLGPVSFTWSGWRHLTRLGRSQNYIHQSLQLLSATPDVIINPTKIVGVRYLPSAIRGDWVTERRLIILNKKDVHLTGRPPANLIVVLRQRIIFPKNWLEDVALHKHIKHEISFESIYEKSKEK